MFAVITKTENKKRKLICNFLQNDLPVRTVTHARLLSNCLQAYQVTVRNPAQNRVRLLSILENSAKFLVSFSK